jgi:CHAD domain-containing protein
MALGFREAEGIPAGIRRMALEEVDRALLRMGSVRHTDAAIHDARRCLKKLRALLRLVRADIGDSVYRRENLHYRDAGRILSAVRDGAAVLEALGLLRGRFGREISDRDFRELRSALDRKGRKQVQVKRAALLASSLLLEPARARIETWPLRGEDFSAFAPGVERVYLLGRRAFQLARRKPSVGNIHEWRKHVKYLWYQVCILRPPRSRALLELGNQLKLLADYLSEDHDLALLGSALRANRQKLADPRKAQSRIQRRRRELQRDAKTLGARIYPDRPADFANRLALRWRTWRVGLRPQAADVAARPALRARAV